jgi:hypothetical protein
MKKEKEKVILAFDFEEYSSIEEALMRARVVKLLPGHAKKIFVIKKEIPWPEK